MTKAIKEIIIMLLVCLVIMLIFAIALYQYIPNRKAVPEIITYVATEEVQDLLEDNIDKNKEEKLNITYEVTSGDLNNYQKENTYVPGKSNPFAAYSTSTSIEGDTTTGNGEDNNETTSKNPNESGETTEPKIYQNNGTK